MAAKVWIGSKARTQYLRRLSIVFAVELRTRIVAELYMREMSPKQFFEEFGGSSLPRVTRNFEILAKHGWLRYIRSEGPGGKRRGGIEHFFRASEPAFCDADTWAGLPYSIRVAFSWSGIKQIAEQLRAALEAAPFSARPDRHLTVKRLLLDQLGWERVIEALTGELVAHFEEQEDARRRVSHSGESLLRVSTILLGFESPMQNALAEESGLVEDRSEPLMPFPVRLSKILRDEMCLQIIAEGNRREISAPLFYREVGGDSVESIRRRIRTLAELGWLKQVGEKTGGRRRSAVERFYKATAPAILTEDGPWSAPPPSLKGSDSWAAFERLSELAREALRAGTFDARDNRCLAWPILVLDRQGWKRVATSVKALDARLAGEQEMAMNRMEQSDVMPIAITVATAAFESPRNLTKAP